MIHIILSIFCLQFQALLKYQIYKFDYFFLLIPKNDVQIIILKCIFALPKTKTFILWKSIFPTL